MSPRLNLIILGLKISSSVIPSSVFLKLVIRACAYSYSSMPFNYFLGGGERGAFKLFLLLLPCLLTSRPALRMLKQNHMCAKLRFMQCKPTSCTICHIVLNLTVGAWFWTLLINFPISIHYVLGSRCVFNCNVIGFYICPFFDHRHCTHHVDVSPEFHPGLLFVACPVPINWTSAEFRLWNNVNFIRLILLCIVCFMF